MSINKEKIDHAQWREKDSNYYLHPFTQYKNLAKDKDCRIISNARGIFIYDVDNKEYIDGMSGLWTCCLGYSNPSISNRVSEQMNRLPFYNSFFKTSNQPAIELAEKLIDLTPTSLEMRQVFYTNSGSEANDTLIQMIRHYWTLHKKPSKRIIISRKNAYHGSSMGAASLGGMKFMHDISGLPIPDIVHIEQPYSFELKKPNESQEEFGVRMAQLLEDKILELGVENIAAFIGEPIQGAGGVIIPPDNYWQEIQKICRKYDILLIADEVITGFGRMGEVLGCVYYDFVPDFIVFAKAVTNGYLPLGGLIVGKRVSETFMASSQEFSHGFTYSGHPTSCTAALETQKILKEKNLIACVKNDIGPYFQEKIKHLSNHRIVGEVRSLGMLFAVELVKEKNTNSRYDNKFTMGTLCRDACINNGLISRAVCDTMILAPPFIISRTEVDRLLTIFEECLDITAKELNL